MDMASKIPVRISQNLGFERSAPILPGRSPESASRRRGAGELEAIS